MMIKKIIFKKNKILILKRNLNNDGYYNCIHLID
jgi:hypothetical protein